jgi:poly(A) polymerase
MQGVQQPPEFHPEGDVWTHTLLMLDGLPAGCSPTLAWGILLHDVGKPPTFKPVSKTGDRIRFDHHVDVGVRMAHAICRRYRFSNDETEQIAALVDNHMRFKDVGQMKKATLKRFVRLPRFDEHMELHRRDCVSSHRNLDSYQFVQRFLAETPPEQVHPQRVLTGNDLSEMGYIPGPRFSEILRAVEDAQLEGQIHTNDEARHLVQSRFPLRKANV